MYDTFCYTSVQNHTRTSSTKWPNSYLVPRYLLLCPLFFFEERILFCLVHLKKKEKTNNYNSNAYYELGMMLYCPIITATCCVLSLYNHKTISILDFD